MFIEKIINRMPIKSNFLKLILGTILTAFLIVLGFVFMIKLLGLDNNHGSTLPALGAFFGAIGGLVFGLRFLKRTGQVSDERFVIHRSHSTYWSSVVGILIMSGWILYDFATHQLVRWDFIIIMGAMAITKWSAMVYYGFKN